MVMLNELEQEEPQHVCLFGLPKSGKTLLAGKLAEKFNLIYIDIENSKDVLFSLPMEYKKRIEVISIPDSRDFPVASETLAKMTKGKVSICQKHGKVSCMVCRREEKEGRAAPSTEVDLLNVPLDTIVIFDTCTQFANSIEAHLVKNEPEDYKPGWDEYNAQGAALDRFLSRLQIAPYHLIVITHAVEVELPNKKKKLVPNAGTRNFSMSMGKYFNHLVYTEVKNGSHRLGSSTTYDPSVLTGSRLGKSLEGQAEPSLLPIFGSEFKAPAVQAAQHSTVIKKPALKTTIKAPTKTIQKGGENAQDILARLKK